MLKLCHDTLKYTHTAIKGNQKVGNINQNCLREEALKSELLQKIRDVNIITEQRIIIEKI